MPCNPSLMHLKKWRPSNKKKADLVSVRRNIVELKTKKVNPYHFVAHYFLVFGG